MRRTIRCWFRSPPPSKQENPFSFIAYDEAYSSKNSNSSRKDSVDCPRVRYTRFHQLCLFALRMVGGEIRRGVPIAICSVCTTPRTRLSKANSGDKAPKDGKPADSASDEVPQILVQGILQYQDNPTLESYT